MGGNYAIPSSGSYPTQLNNLFGKGTSGWYNYIKPDSSPDWWRRELEEEPTRGYNAFSTFVGAGNQGYTNWLKNQYDRYYGQYSLGIGGQPGTWFIDWLSGTNPRTDYAFSSPFERGSRMTYSPSMRLVR
jgi:hypothetical protein